MTGFKSNGDLYFTDPPYGLPLKADDPGREMDFCGVYRYSHGKVTLLTKELSGPTASRFRRTRRHCTLPFRSSASRLDRPTR